MARRPALTLGDIQRAAEVVSTVAHETPLLTSRTLSELTGAQLLLKAENLQRTGSFKIRGASFKLSTLSASQRTAGVVAASAGNHAQGVALAAADAGIPCRVVMPVQASMTKVAATRAYGAEVILHGATFDEAQRRARDLAEDQGLTLIPAFDDVTVIAGQGVVGLELCRQAPDFDMVIVPVGGGGLISGIATAVKALRPGTLVVGAQVEAATVAAQSFASGRRTSVTPQPTLADGVAVGQPGAIPLRIMRDSVDEIVTVTDREVAWAIALLLERTKLLVEGAGAVGLAALLSGRVRAAGKTVAVVLSGGNIDPVLLGRILDHGLARQGRFVLLNIILPDAPGGLSRVLRLVADAGANVVDIVHHRHGPEVLLGRVRVEILAETGDQEHVARLTKQIRSAGFDLLDP